MRKYVMNHDDATQRRVMGAQCRNAFEGAQVVVTYPFSSDMTGVDLRGIQA